MSAACVSPTRLLVTWQEIESDLLPVLAALPHPRARRTTLPADILRSRPLWAEDVRAKLTLSSVHSSSASNPDATLNTLRYLFFHMRCGILVCVRNGAVCVFQPFANSAYRNTWSDRVMFAGGGNGEEYQRRKQTDTRMRAEVWLDPTAWWLNGGIVCSVQPHPEIWGSAHLAELHDMLCQLCGNKYVPDCDFFINKRDYPQLRRDGKEPYGRFIGERRLCREVYSAYAPVLSFYSGTLFADCTIPLTEDWKRATTSANGSEEDFEAGWNATVQKAVWRGTATGSGIDAATNPRLRLVSLSSELIDVGLTGFNFRDKLRVGADGNALVVDYLKPKWERVPFMSLEAQAAQFRYCIYVDGHCAANRYTALMRSRRTILRVASERETDGGQMWLLFDLVPAEVHVDGAATVPEHADHFRILSDYSNLESTIEYLRRHDDVAKKVALCAASKCPTKIDILQALEFVLYAVHDFATHTAESHAGRHALFSAYDLKYSRLCTDENGLFFCKP